jgi:hypothetical protein
MVGFEVASPLLAFEQGLRYDPLLRFPLIVMEAELWANLA